MAFSRGRTRVPTTVDIPDKKGLETSGIHVQVRAPPVRVRSPQLMYRELQMETFAQISESMPADPNYVRYDATGCVVKADEESYMGDSPTIAGDDYKRPEY